MAQRAFTDEAKGSNIGLFGGEQPVFRGVENAPWARYAGGEGRVSGSSRLSSSAQAARQPPFLRSCPVIIAGIVFTVCVLVVSLALTWVLG